MVRVVVIAQPLAALWFWKAAGLPRGKPGSLQQADTKSAAASKACQVGTRISWGHWQLLDCTHCRGSMHASNHRRLATSVYTVERQRELKPQKCCAPGRYAYRISLAGRPAKAAVLNDTISNPRQAPHSPPSPPLASVRCSPLAVPPLAFRLPRRRSAIALRACAWLWSTREGQVPKLRVAIPKGGVPSARSAAGTVPGDSRSGTWRKVGG